VAGGVYSFAFVSFNDALKRLAVMQITRITSKSHSHESVAPECISFAAFVRGVRAVLRFNREFLHFFTRADHDGFSPVCQNAQGILPVEPVVLANSSSIPSYPPTFRRHFGNDPFVPNPVCSSCRKNRFDFLGLDFYYDALSPLG
jgi:hypothetical protein